MSSIVGGVNDRIRRFLLFRRGRRWIMLLTLTLIWPMTKAPAGLQIDDEVEGDSQVIPAMPLEDAVARVRGWVFQLPMQLHEDGSKFDPRNADEVLTLMDWFGVKRIAVVDQLCGLAVEQKEKLRLAVHGDHKRLIDRIEKMGAELRLVKSDGEQIELQKSARLLSNELVWLCRDDSLFAKTVEHVLTPEQEIKYRPLRDALRKGCHVGLNRLGPEAGLEIIVSRTNFADGDLQHLGKLPGISMLSLGHLPITDAGMAHVEGLAGLRYLQLNDVAVTDAGLAHLRRLTNLRCLSLTRTQVTLDGLTDLKQASPRLQINHR